MCEDFRIRKGCEADVAAMYALDVLCFEEPFRFDLRAMRRFAMRLGSIVLVAEDAAGLLVGFVILEVRGASAYVVTLDVRPEYRRQGVAQALMRDAERMALHSGVERVRLHVFAGNPEALRFYEAYGFVRYAVAEDFYGSGLDGVCCVRRIVG